MLQCRPMYARRISLSCFRHLVRAVLLMYVLTLGVAMASSMVKSRDQGMNLICTSTGYKFVKISSDDNQPAQTGQKAQSEGKHVTHLLDCSLCLGIALPADFPQTSACETPHVLSYATRSIPAARLASLVSAPLPARGPPAI